MMRIDAPTQGLPVTPRAASGTAERQQTEPVSAPAPVGDINGALDHLNRYLHSVSSDVRFSIDDSSGHPVVRVVDPGTHEVIRQMPTEEALAMSRALDRSMGLLLRDMF